MAEIGRMNEFDTAKEIFTTDINRCNLDFSGNEITVKKKEINF